MSRNDDSVRKCEDDAAVIGRLLVWTIVYEGEFQGKWVYDVTRKKIWRG